MTKQERQDIEWDAAQRVLAKKDELMKEAFNLCRKLTTEAYNHGTAQLDDMEKVGELAKKARAIWSTANIIRKA